MKDRHDMKDIDILTIAGGGMFVTSVVSLVLFYGFDINLHELDNWIQIGTVLCGFGLGFYAIKKKNKRNENAN